MATPTLPGRAYTCCLGILYNKFLDSNRSSSSEYGTLAFDTGGAPGNRGAGASGATLGHSKTAFSSSALLLLSSGMSVYPL